MTYYVYIMASSSRVLYIGVTNNIQRRAIDHREGRIRGFTAKYKTRKLVHVEAFGDIRSATAREKQLKGWLRARKIGLIESSNPHWRDLSAVAFVVIHTATNPPPCHSERSEESLL